MKPKVTAKHIEIAVAKLLNYRVYTIVPNVSWGLGLSHECDMLALDNKDRFTEIEIKTTLQDLKADFQKSHGHKSEIISRLVYAFPLDLLESALTLIPRSCGIIVVRPYPNGKKYKAEWYRVNKHDSKKKKPNSETIRKFMELGCMRIWSLKEHGLKT